MTSNNVFLSATNRIAIGAFAVCLFAACGDINSVSDPHFSEDGRLKSDPADTIVFTPKAPEKIKLYVEVSGSMNGFFRADQPTDFKHDLWQIVNGLPSAIQEITVLGNDGDTGTSITLQDFQTKMNTGAFVSSASTKVPVMLEHIISGINDDGNEVAILVSDMKYSPVGAAAPKVLMSQYCTDISRILNKYSKAVCLIGATSSYLDKNGDAVTDKSPYYYLLIGNSENVTYLRNCISAMLDANGHFIENIESGIDYHKTPHSFGKPQNCYHRDKDEPTFIDASPADTCIIRLNVELDNYRWIMSTPESLAEALKVRCLYNSKVKTGMMSLDVQNVINPGNTLTRKATATIELKVYDMPMSSDVLEWSLELPDMETGRLAPYLDAADEDDVTKSYSVDSFIKGMFHGGNGNQNPRPNYILISQNS